MEEERPDQEEDDYDRSSLSGGLENSSSRPPESLGRAAAAFPGHTGTF